MRRHIFILSIALALGFVACDKTEVAKPVEDEGSISFAPQTVETRALINSVTDLRYYTLKIWDIWSGQTTPYIDNTLVYSQDWQYGNTADTPYYWKAGTHKFFSYLDGMGTYSSSDKKLTVSKVLTTADDDQKDLLYSDIFTTTAAEWKANHTATSPVPLTFNHLLSCIGLVVKNGTGSSITVNSVSASIPNDGGATVDFSGTEVDTLYTEVSVNETTPFISATALGATTLAADGFIDVLKQAVGQETAEVDTNYFVIWPQTFEEGDVTVTVKYTIGEDENATDYDKTVKIPAGVWKAGNKYTYTLNIQPTLVQLIFAVQPWDSGQAGTISTATGSINMSNVTWMNTKVKETSTGPEVNTVDNDNYSVYMYYHPYVKNGNAWQQYTDNNGYFPAQGYFTVNYPEAGSYKIELIPAYGESSVQANKYVIYIYKNGSWVAHNSDGEAISHDTVYFRICAASGQDGSQHKAQINILFKPQGSTEWISAYSEVRATYALIIPATGN